MLMLSVEPVALNEETLTVVLEICTTCITSACFALTILDFPVVFMDEASMSTEPAALIPIMKGVGSLTTSFTVL